MRSAARRRWSWVLLVSGGLLFFAAGIAGWVNSAIVNGQHFADHANAVRQDPAVRAEIGELIAGAAVDANSDLVAVQPAIAGASSALVGSSAFDSAFTGTLKAFHSALTESGSTSAVLTIADIGATVTSALEQFVPAAASVIPKDLNLTLAQVGGQTGIAAQIIPVIQGIRAAALLLPLLAIALLAAAVWVAPQRRLALVRAGWTLVIGGGFLGLLVILLALVAAAADTATLAGALASAVITELSKPLTTRFIATVVVGGLIVASAGALLPQFELHGYIRRGLGYVTWTPARPSLQVLRSLVIVGLGVAVVLNPTLSAQFLAVCAGLVVFFYGVAELDRVAERYLAEDEARAAALLAAGDSPKRRRTGGRRWVIPLVGVGVGSVIVGLLLLPQALPQQGLANAASGDPDGCNGHVELCDRPFNNVAFAASHNSMSAADEKGWFLAEQPTGIVNSLDDGIRAVLVDTWYGQRTQSGSVNTADRSLDAAEKELVAEFPPEITASVRRTIDRIRGEKGVGKVEPYFCHTVCEIGATRVLPVLRDLKAWLDAHPREVVIMFIQDKVSPEDTAEVFQAAGLDEMAYTYRDGQPWPTLRQMIEANKRLVVLMENDGGGSQYPWLMQGFDVVQDTEYTFADVEDFTCTLKRGTAQSPLLGINHWLKSFAKLVTNAEKVNAYDVLNARVKQCQAERGMVPNIIAVNWYNKGDLRRVVDEVNLVSGQ